MYSMASGSNIQPFKTIKDYKNWLKRIDDYLLWLQSAQERMRQGMTSKYTLPKSLIIKIIPQIESITNTNFKDNIF